VFLLTRDIFSPLRDLRKDFNILYGCTFEDNKLETKKSANLQFKHFSKRRGTDSLKKNPLDRFSVFLCPEGEKLPPNLAKTFKSIQWRTLLSPAWMFQSLPTVQ